MNLRDANYRPRPEPALPDRDYWGSNMRFSAQRPAPRKQWSNTRIFLTACAVTTALMYLAGWVLESWMAQ